LFERWYPGRSPKPSSLVITTADSVPKIVESEERSKINAVFLKVIRAASLAVNDAESGFDNRSLVPKTAN
jgi:hypothetical protein